MRTALAAVLLACLLRAGVPIARALLPALRGWDAALFGPPLALGAFAWLLFWIGLLPGAPLHGWGVALAWGIVCGAGVAAARAHAAPPGETAPPRRRLTAPALACWALLAVFAGGAAVCAMFFPATNWDFLARYGWHAKLMFRDGQLGAQVVGYPPLVALLGTAAHAALGAVDEPAAKLQGPLFGALLLALTFRLAWNRRRPWIARVAVLAVGLSPVFLNSVPSGDPDLAMSCYLTAALALLVMPPAGPPARLAVACGAYVGLALWAKQAAGPALVSLAALALVRATGKLRWRWLAARTLAVSLAVAAVVAVPWYARNLALEGRALPLANPDDMVRADRSLASLVAPLRWWSELGVAAPLFALGLAWLAGHGLRAGLTRGVPVRPLGLALAAAVVAHALAVRAGWRHPPFDVYLTAGGALVAACALVRGGRLRPAHPHAILGLWVLPLFAVWWVKFSFTARYLLPALPVLALAGARAAERALAPALRRSVAWVALVPLAALLTDEMHPLWRQSLARLVDRSLASREEKWEGYPGGVFRAARWLSAQGAERARIATNDGRLAYFLDRATLVPLPATPSELAGADWVVLAPFGTSALATPDEAARALEPARRALGAAPRVFAEAGYEVYRTR